MTPAKRHAISVNLDKCTGCVHCLTACPTQAIRIRDGKARVIDRQCIDCGECIRHCPRDAIESHTTSFSDLQRFAYKVAIPATALYGQFGNSVLPYEILFALRKIGFDHVYDLSAICELYIAAVEEFLTEHAQPRPVIASTCPVVVRLIQRRFPTLSGLIVPFEPPREIGAKILRSTLPAALKLKPEDIGIIHITPCPAKLVSINHPATMKKSYLDGAVSIRDIYPPILDILRKKDDTAIMRHLFPDSSMSGLGIGWSISGGETRSLPKFRTVAVSGVQDTIHVLDQVESGLLRDVDYLECMVCPDGCVGGPLSIENRFLAKSRILHLAKKAGDKSVIDRSEIRTMYRENFLSFQHPVEPQPSAPLDADPAEAIRKAGLRDEILRRLPGKNCGFCGAPDCATLADDIVRGLADIRNCPMTWKETP